MNIRIITSLTTALILAGCATKPAGKATEDVVTVVGTGIVADRLSHGNPAATIAAAGAALVGKKYIDYANAKKKDQAVKDAFDLGQLQATKSLAAAIQHTQDTDLPDHTDTNKVTVPLTIPERKVDGVIINGGVENVPVQN